MAPLYRVFATVPPLRPKLRALLSEHVWRSPTGWLEGAALGGAVLGASDATDDPVGWGVLADIDELLRATPS